MRASGGPAKMVGGVGGGVGGGGMAGPPLRQPAVAEQSARVVLWQLLSALRTMHAAGWSHGDVKTENILVSAVWLAVASAPTAWVSSAAQRLVLFGIEVEPVSPATLARFRRRECNVRLVEPGGALRSAAAIVEDHELLYANAIVPLVTAQRSGLEALLLPEVKLADYGKASPLPAAPGGGFARTAPRFGTLTFLSPELARLQASRLCANFGTALAATAPAAAGSGAQTLSASGSDAGSTATMAVASGGGGGGGGGGSSSLLSGSPLTGGRRGSGSSGGVTRQLSHFNLNAAPTTGGDAGAAAAAANARLPDDAADGELVDMSAVDVYDAGLVLCTLLFGRLPLRDTTAVADVCALRPADGLPGTRAAARKAARAYFGAGLPAGGAVAGPDGREAAQVVEAAAFARQNLAPASEAKLRFLRRTAVFDANIDHWDFNPNAYDLSHLAKDLLLHLLDADPAKRPSAEAALQHPWFNVLRQPTPQVDIPGIVFGPPPPMPQLGAALPLFSSPATGATPLPAPQPVVVVQHAQHAGDADGALGLMEEDDAHSGAVGIGIGSGSGSGSGAPPLLMRPSVFAAIDEDEEDGDAVVGTSDVTAATSTSATATSATATLGVQPHLHRPRSSSPAAVRLRATASVVGGVTLLGGSVAPRPQLQTPAAAAAGGFLRSGAVRSATARELEDDEDRMIVPGMTFLPEAAALSPEDLGHNFRSRSPTMSAQPAQSPPAATESAAAAAAVVTPVRVPLVAGGGSADSDAADAATINHMRLQQRALLFTAEGSSEGIRNSSSSASGSSGSSESVADFAMSADALAMAAAPPMLVPSIFAQPGLPLMRHTGTGSSALSGASGASSASSVGSRRSGAPSPLEAVRSEFSPR